MDHTLVPRLAAVPVAMAASALLTACAALTPPVASPEAGGCPRDVSRRLSAEAPADPVAVDVLADRSLSLRQDAAWAEQLPELAADLADLEAAVRVTAFTGSSSRTLVVLDCGAVVADVANEAAREAKTRQLVGALTAALRDAVRAAPSEGGTDIAGAVRAVSELPSRPGRHAVLLLTDGESTVEQHTPQTAYLDGATSVGLFGLGRSADAGASTQEVERLQAFWFAHLTAAGARRAVVTPNTYTSGALQGVLQ